ncbi:MAG: 1-deoxy-D-xylulose-5-phosphate reductoisomerase [Paracoccaceae bacterium]
MKRVSILGATGSIGQNTIDLIRRDRTGFEVVALTGGRNVDLLAKSAVELGAKHAAIAEDSLYQDLKDALAGSGIGVSAGRSAILQAAAMPSDWVMSSIVGAAGLEPGLIAMSNGADLALANKESMVAAGRLMKATAAEKNVQILPTDSEHSAIFQALMGQSRSSVERIIITASGGAFRNWSKAELATVTPEQAMVHPNWSMGSRITIDSASMFNKGLEVIEAKEFFEIDATQIEVVIHPQSIVHALVGFHDGNLLAHVGPPDMRHAIGFALYYPERKPLPLNRLDLTKIGQLDFAKPDQIRFPALKLAYDVLELGGVAGAVYNASKEVALDAFMARQIGFLNMAEVVERTLHRLFARSCELDKNQNLENILYADHMGRKIGHEEIQALSA